MTATLPEEVGSPHRALAPIVNRKNRITGCKALSRPQPEFRPFEAIDHIGFPLEKCQLILKLSLPEGILVRVLSDRVVSKASEFVSFDQDSTLRIPEIAVFRAGKHQPAFLATGLEGRGFSPAVTRLC